MNKSKTGRKGFTRKSDSMRWGVRINSNIVKALRDKDINIASVVRKGIRDLDLSKVEKQTSVGIYGRFQSKEDTQKYLALENKRLVIENILLKRLLGD